LPREIGARRALDHRSELVVLDGRERAFHLRLERRGRRDLPVIPSRRDPFDHVERPDAEAEALHFDAGRSVCRGFRELLDDLRCEHRELVRPDARDDLHDEQAALERDGTRPVRDARADGRAPAREGNRQLLSSEAIFTRSFEHVLERFRSVEATPFLPLAAAHPGPLRWYHR
jgi:hypothetical protein